MPFDWASAGAAIARLLTAGIAFLQNMITRKDQIELGQARQADADRAIADQARERMDKAAAQPIDTDMELRDGTF